MPENRREPALAPESEAGATAASLVKEATEAPDIDRLRAYRLARVREQLRRNDLGAIILQNPVNIRYATDARNMAVWTLYNQARYVFVPLSGPVILFEFIGAEHVCRGLPTIDEIRTATGWGYFGTGDRWQEMATRWADELADVIRATGCGTRIAIDRCDPAGAAVLGSHGLELVDGQSLMEQARVIKSPDEILCIRNSIAVAEMALARLRERIAPGVTEAALWSTLGAVNGEEGGEWIDTRLLSSGPRTAPWYQEAGDRQVEPGDLVTVDTDMIGPRGYLADISRSFICDGVTPNDDQTRLYRLAVEQLEYNLGMIRAGAGFRELSERSWRMPARCYPNRYCYMVHGVGLADEYPGIPYIDDFIYDGELEAGMTVCVESYLGDADLGIGIKLEQQVLVTETGCEVLSSFPYEERLLPREV